MVHRNQIASTVNTTLSGEDNRFMRTQAIGPVVLMGAGRSGYVPGAYSSVPGRVSGTLVVD